MDELETGLRDIAAIRSMMERSSKFLSLSGLSGISAGVIALAGAWAAYAAIPGKGYSFAAAVPGAGGGELPGGFLIADAACVLVLALACSTLLSIRKARKKGYPLWGPATMYLLSAFLIPLGAGGGFCGILIQQGLPELIPAATLVFYGLALVSAGNFTFGEVRYLGVIDLFLGLTAGVRPALGLILWAGGFGVLHIVYGMLLYREYER